MSQNDFTIANQGFPAFRADLNSALQALASNSSGATAPSTTFANMWWYDSANNIMYIRNEDNDAWIKFAELDQTNDKFVLSGTLQLDDGTVSAPALTFNSDTNMGIYRGGTDILKFVTAGTDAITIDASQNVTLANNLSITGNGSTSDLTGSNIFRIMGDDVRITNSAGSEAMATSTADGAVTLYHDANPKLATTSTGIDVTGTAVTDGLTVAGNVSIDGGTIKLDGNYPVGTANVALGDTALDSLTSGTRNVGIGSQALTANTTASGNVAVGYEALISNTTGEFNTAIGRQTLYSNTTSNDNSAVGLWALYSNTTGASNTGVGRQALYSNTTASNNTAVGYQASYSRNNTTGNSTALGYKALYSATASNNVTAIGYQSLQNTTANRNTGLGTNAGYNITTGLSNTALGSSAIGGSTNTITGSNNIGIGSWVDGVIEGPLASLSSGTRNIAIGNGSQRSLTTGDQNVSVGYGSLKSSTNGGENNAFGYEALSGLSSGAYCIAIGANAGSGISSGSAVSTSAGSILIGRRCDLGTGSDDYSIVMGINAVGKGTNTGHISPNGGGVYQGNNSSTWSTTSDERIKKNIIDNNIGLDAINQVQVRNFEYRTEDEITELPTHSAIDKQGLQLGVIAQEIQTVLPDMVKEESTGVLSVNPDNMTWYLVNAVKELSAQITELQSEIAILKGE